MMTPFYYKTSRSISRVLFLHKQVFVIYLDLLSPTSSSDLPPDIGRAILHTPVYMVLQLARGTAPDITTGTGELLPHLFTLTPDQIRSGYFLLPYSTLTDSFPLGNTMLCIARTFLPLPRIVSDKPTYCCFGYKITIIY